MPKMVKRYIQRLIFWCSSSSETERWKIAHERERIREMRFICVRWQRAISGSCGAISAERNVETCSERAYVQRHSPSAQPLRSPGRRCVSRPFPPSRGGCAESFPKRLRWIPLRVCARSLRTNIRTTIAVLRSLHPTQSTSALSVGALCLSLGCDCACACSWTPFRSELHRLASHYVPTHVHWRW